jgi:RNA polymerase sigma-70 factor, ECF subfamily
MRNDLAGASSVIPFHRPGNQKSHTANDGKRKHDNSDEVLIREVGSGNKAAMRILFARHHKPVYRFLLRAVGNDALAEDLTSEVFLSVWRQAHRFEARSAVSTWLLAIARYKAIAELRRRPGSMLDEYVDTFSSADDPEAELQSKHRGEILRKCLTRLSREHREIIDLVYYHEKSVQEVAEIIGIPRNTVKTRMFYARQRLSELLKVEGAMEASF